MMEKQTGFLGISNLVWLVIGAVGVVVLALIWALVAAMFGLDSGGVPSS